MFREILYVLLLSAFGVLMTLISNAEGFQWLHVQFIVVISLYLYYRNNIAILFLLPYLFILDINREVQPAFGMLAFTLGGLILSILSRWWPLFKQYPFSFGRMSWLILTVALYIAFQGGASADGFKLFLVSVPTNIFIMLFLTYGLEPLILRRSDVDIEIG
jgi:hypothetical protein